MEKRRPSLADRAMFVIARLHAERTYRGFVSATRHVEELQRRILLKQIRANADSRFGRDHQFDRIRSIEDFTGRVPLGDYESHRSYIDAVKNGDTRALFGPGQRVLMFALSSGTTNEPKYIPVTDAFLKSYRRGWNTFGIKALLDHEGTFLRKILQVASPMDEERTSAGIACGAISGLMAATQKRLVRKYYVTPSAVASITDAAAKYYAIMRLAVPTDIAFMITASPATQLCLARAADDNREQLIRDIRDGTLWASLPIEPGIRKILLAGIRPNPACARRLERLVETHDALLPRHYWRLGFLANWTGGTIGLHLANFPHYFGDTPVRDIGLLASEGRVSIPIEDGTAAGILDVAAHYFEFIAEDDADRGVPRTLRAQELEVGGNYYVVMTTASGMYRYQLGDVVRVSGFMNTAPIVEFLHKGSHISSMSGEKLTEHQVVHAMRAATSAVGMKVVNFVLAPRWAQRPFYMLHIESGVVPKESLLKHLADALDSELLGLNIEYAGKRGSGRLGPVRLNVLPDGFLSRLDSELAARYRKINEQYKHQYLYIQPGDDAAFPAPGGLEAKDESSRSRGSEQRPAKFEMRSEK